MPANRPQPYQMPEAEFFWSSGADGTLRILHCDDCDQLVHPPKPVCHYCRGTHLAPTDVSGAGTVVAWPHSSMCSSRRSSHHAIHPQPDSRNATRSAGCRSRIPAQVKLNTAICCSCGCEHACR